MGNGLDEYTISALTVDTRTRVYNIVEIENNSYENNCDFLHTTVGRFWKKNLKHVISDCEIKLISYDNKLLVKIRNGLEKGIYNG